MLNLEKSEFLSKEEVRTLAPSVFGEASAPKTSEKYVHIPTSVLIDDMDLLGWKVADVKEVKAHKDNTLGFQKHLLIFRNPDINITGKDGDDVFPQICISNSHDGNSCFLLVAGLFRMICENGLIITTEEFENLKIRHMGYNFDELQEQVRLMVERLPLTVETMNKMKNTELRDTQIVDFARKAVRTRLGKGDQTVDIETLITPSRKEDEGKDLWTVFNVLQEKLINGNFEYRSKNKIRKAREIKNFSQDQELNKDLFRLALSYAA